jgi:hypothetical protein
MPPWGRSALLYWVVLFYHEWKPFVFMSFRQEPYIMRHKVIITTICVLILVVVVGGVIHLKQYKLTEPELGPPLAESTEIAPGSAKVWIGLKNSDDQGTNFDVRAELLKNGTVIASGETRCITGVTRNPDKAKEVTVALSPMTNLGVAAGDVLSLKISTRIGTNPKNTKCPGHSNAVGLRLYYDGTTRPSRFGAAIPPSSLKDYFLHSGSNDFLDTTAPTATTAKFKDSPGINFKNGNPWQAIGAWEVWQRFHSQDLGVAFDVPSNFIQNMGAQTPLFSTQPLPDTTLHHGGFPPPDAAYISVNSYENAAGISLDDFATGFIQRWEFRLFSKRSLVVGGYSAIEAVTHLGREPGAQENIIVFIQANPTKVITINLELTAGNTNHDALVSQFQSIVATINLE